MSKVTEIFTHIVQIDSPSGSEGKMSLFLQEWLKKHGFSVKIDKVGNVLGQNHIAGQPLLLCAHMDTVSPGKGIKPVIVDGVIRSGGKTVLGADNKAAVVAIMIAVEETKNMKPLEILFTVKEETGGGIEHFPLAWLVANKGLVFDSAKPLGGIVLRSPYIANFSASITGRAAHASSPAEGINAFSPAIAALQLIKTGVLDGGETTVNVGLIEGGTGINTVPDTITIQGEVRSYDKHLFEKQMALIKTVFSTESKNAGTDLGFAISGYCPGYAHKKSAVYIKQVCDMMKKAGLDAVYYPHSGVSDANILNENGICTVNLTDGTKFAHTVNEQIAIADLELLVKLVRTCIASL